MCVNWSINSTSFVFLPDPAEHENFIIIEARGRISIESLTWTAT